LGAVQFGEVFQRLRDIGVIGPEHVLPDRQGPLIERLGIGVAGLCLVECGQIVQRRRDRGVIGTKRFLEDRQRPLVEWLGIGVATLDAV